MHVTSSPLVWSGPCCTAFAASSSVLEDMVHSQSLGYECLIYSRRLRRAKCPNQSSSFKRLGYTAAPHCPSNYRTFSYAIRAQCHKPSHTFCSASLTAITMSQLGWYIRRCFLDSRSSGVYAISYHKMQQPLTWSKSGESISRWYGFRADLLPAAAAQRCGVVWKESSDDLQFCTSGDPFYSTLYSPSLHLSDKQNPRPLRLEIILLGPLLWNSWTGFMDWGDFWEYRLRSRRLERCYENNAMKMEVFLVKQARSVWPGGSMYWC